MVTNYLLNRMILQVSFPISWTTKMHECPRDLALTNCHNHFCSMNIGSSANMGPHTNTKLDLICLLWNLDYIHIQEICLNSKVFPVHDNTYNIEDLTQYSIFWHMVDIAYITHCLFTSHRSCSLAMNPVKFHGSDCCHENSHHFHGRPSKWIGPPKLVHWTPPKVPRNIPTHTTSHRIHGTNGIFI